MNAKGVILCLGMAVIAAGCFTVDKAPVRPGFGEHVVMRNVSYKLFDCIPLFGGNASADASVGCVFFRDDATLEKMQERFVQYANGRATEGLVCDVNNRKTVHLLGLPVPYLFTYKAVTVSGTIK